MTRHATWPATLAAAALLAGCGASSGSPSGTPGRPDPALRFADCMRSHGVTNFPDPNSDGGLKIGPDLNPASPAFQTAQRACRRLLPNGGSPPRMSETQFRAALAFAQCMRSHGLPSFPDPTRSAPKGATRVLVLRGMLFVIGPGLDPRSPAFKQAASACGIRFP